jgi:hypothetical protein
MIYPPLSCYKCGAIGEGVGWRELPGGEALPTCERHKPMLVAFRDLHDAIVDFGRAVRRALRG